MGIYLYNIEQIQKIEKACLIAADVLDKIDEVICEGISTYDLDKLAREVISNMGSKPAFLGYKGFPSALCTSINEVVVHGIPDKKAELKEGDIIGIDVGVYHKGFYGDTARTYRIGNISAEADLLMKVTRQALYLGIERCIVDNRISDISNAVEEHVIKNNFMPVREFVGHGIGKALHEEPSVPNYGKPGVGPRIKNGMVFAIEPMINAGTFKVEVDKNDGWTVYTKDRRLSAHFEHTVAVVDGKAKILTRGKSFN